MNGISIIMDEILFIVDELRFNVDKTRRRKEKKKVLPRLETLGLIFTFHCQRLR